MQSVIQTTSISKKRFWTGVVLPGLLRIRQELTPLAAAGLAIIMAGATVITIAGGAVAPALFPLGGGPTHRVRRI